MRQGYNYRPWRRNELLDLIDNMQGDILLFTRMHREQLEEQGERFRFSGIKSRCRFRAVFLENRFHNTYATVF